ncbi:MAG: efflux RND transporter permease subunit [Elusimicrobia bacterium]|nr:efflux RND transporter permease subunit [Elusimicrobiota bacterium]
MILSDLSIKKPVFAWMLMIGLIAFGAVGFNRMGVSQLPDVDFPVLSVSIDWEGAAPEVIETEITDVIEDAVMSVQGIQEVSSTSRQGSARVTLEFELSKDIDVALQEVQSKLAQAQRLLPRDADPAVVSKSNPEDQPILWLAVSGDKPRRDLMEYVRDHVKDRFTTVPGVAEVFLGGYVEPNLRVWLDADRLRARELAAEDILRAIEAQHAEVPAGRIETGRQELNVRVLGEAATVDEFRRIIVPSRSGSPIYRTLRLGDVAEVEDGLADVRRISRVNGVSAVGLGIRKQRGANAVSVAKAVKERMAAVQKDLPAGLTVGVNFDTTQFIEESVHELVTTLVLAAVLTSIVCWVFLGSFSSALNVILAIPTSIIGAFILLYFFGFTLNTFTLLGLSLCVGIVVDDAIMVLENIVRHREAGQSRVKAALIGAREITFAALAATVAILAIFVPVIFMKGIVGKFLYQFGVTLSVAVSLSLLEALTLAPMRCSQFLEVGHSTALGRGVDRVMKSLAQLYARSLHAVLAWRWTVVGVATLVFVLSLGLAKSLKKEFVPSQDQSRFLIRVQTALGTSLEVTDEAMRRVEAALAARPEIEKYFGAVGGFGGGDVNSGMMFVTMKPKGRRPVAEPFRRAPGQSELIDHLRKELKKIEGIQRVSVQDLSQSGFTSQRGYPVEFSLRGRDFDKMGEITEGLMKKMVDSGLMVDIDTDYRLGMPEVRVAPDREKANERGVTVASIANTINAMIGGVRAGKYTRGGKRYDIRLRLADADRRRPADIGKIFVRNNRGELVRLSDVVSLVEKPTLLTITRKNRERSIGLFANVATGKSQGEALAFVEGLGRSLPEGYRIVFSGSAQTYKESFQSLMFALVLGLFVAYMVLGAQFNSFIHPFTVLLALPFSVTGAFLALKLTGITLNIYSMIGLLLLMGIVKKNSILLVEFTNERRKLGRDVHSALLEACPVRLRPILMTSVSTIAGAIPAALSLGAGAETVRPMAVVVIGGMIASTLLTLFVVPAAYSLLARLQSHRHDKDLKEALVELGELESGGR